MCTYNRASAHVKGMIIMMLVPRRNFDVFDDFFDDSFFKENTKMMKTDIKEHDNNYELIVDLPGLNKENIKLEIDNGYLTISAKTSSDNEEKEEGKFIRRERYSGEYQRSFYVGDEITEEDIKASFKNGILDITLPKKEYKEEQTKKCIEIED